MAVRTNSHETTKAGGVVLVTFHILKVAMTIRAFDRSAVRYTRGIGQTKRTTMSTHGTMLFDVVISFVTMITVEGMFRYSRHGKNRIVMLVVV